VYAEARERKPGATALGKCDQGIRLATAPGVAGESSPTGQLSNDAWLADVHWVSLLRQLRYIPSAAEGANQAYAGRKLAGYKIR
jgi:hypothetical protein